MHARTRLFVLLLSSLCTALSAGCDPSRPAFTPQGYQSPHFPYAVRYGDPVAREFLGPDWRVDNYYVLEGGWMGDLKSTAPYKGREAIDLLGDGHLTTWSAYYYDLKLDNRKTGATIWIQTTPLGHNDEDRNLRNLVERYADLLSGTGFFASVNDGREIKSRTFAATIVDGKDTTLAGVPAYDARLELANVDQLRLDPNARTSIIRIILLRPGYRQDWDDALRVKPLVTQTLVRVGYVARPADFDAGLPDFERFLTLLDLGRPPSGR